MKDHLGNVRAIVDDTKVPKGTAGNLNTWLFAANVSNIFNYYPFGKLYPGSGIYNRLEDYSYGFNGMRRDDDIKEKGGVYNHGARLISNDVPMWFSRDPLEYLFSNRSTYVAFNNNPISYIDPDGKVGLQSIFANSYASNKSDVKLKSYMDNNYILTIDKVVKTSKFIAEISDINDLHIAKQMLSGSKNVKTIFGEPAGTIDKIMVLFPAVSGGAVGKLFKTFKEKRLYLKLNFSEKISNAWAGSNKLRKNLLKSGKGINGQKWEAHHIIPKELIGQNKVVNDAIDAGFDFNSIENGIALPSSVHSGRHGNYTKQIEDLINNELEELTSNGAKYTAEKAEGILENIIEKVKSEVSQQSKNNIKVNEMKIKN